MSSQLTETLWRIEHEREESFSGNNIPAWVLINKAGNHVCGDNWRRRVFQGALRKAEIVTSEFMISVIRTQVF